MYKVGNNYDLEFLRQEIINGRPYLIVTDGTDNYYVPAYTFQIDWPDQVTKLITCYCYESSLNKTRFRQERYELLRNRYHNNTIEKFNIIEEVKDREDENKIIGYKLIDIYGIDHFIPKYSLNPNRVHYVGETIELLVRSIQQKELNKSRLDLRYPASRQNLKPQQQVLVDSTTNDNEFVDLEEGQTVEFKTSAVYMASTSQPDVASQGKIIMQTIAGFMNADGGQLLIGVNDRGQIVGFESDLAYLGINPDEVHDKYALHLRNYIIKSLGQIANSLVTINFKRCESNNKEYCEILIRKSISPIYCERYHIFKRMGNMTAHLQSDCITDFFERLFSPSVEKSNHTIKEVENESNVVNIPSVDQNEMEEYEPKIENDDILIEQTNIQEYRYELSLHPGIQDKRGYLYFFANGSCQYIANRKVDKIDDYLLRTPLPRNNAGSYNLFIFYSDGSTDNINMGSALYRAGRIRTTPINKAWNTDKTILDAFCVKRTSKDLIAYVSETNSLRYIKIHEHNAVAKSPHKNFGNNGNKMLSEGSKLLYVIHLEGDTNNRTLLEQSGLIFSTSKRYENGVCIDSLGSNTISILRPLLDGFGAMPNLPIIDIPKEENIILFVMSKWGKIYHTLRGAALDKSPYTYSNLLDACKLHYPDLTDSELRFVEMHFSGKKFEKDFASELLSAIYNHHRYDIQDDSDSVHMPISLSDLEEKVNKKGEELKTYISNTHIILPNNTYSFYNPSKTNTLIS